jgi:hypothetical protein
VNAWQAAMIVAGRRIASRSVALALLAGALCVAGSGWLERGHALALGRAGVLRGTTLGLVVPLMAFFLVARATHGGPLEAAVRSLGRAGCDRRIAVVALAFTVETFAAVAGACLAALGAWSAPVQAGALPGFGTILFVGAIGGTSYAALFVWGASLGSRGGGRPALLVLDWMLGVSSSAWGLPWPRAHLRCLLGGDAVIGMMPWGSALALVVLAVVATGWTAARTPP